VSFCIRVLHVVPDMAYGGVEKVVLNYFEQLDHKKYKFDYVTHGTVENYHQDLVDQGSTLFYFKTIGNLGYSRYKKQVKEQLNLENYDIIHIHTGHLVGLYAKVFRDLGARKVICHAHITECVNPKHSVFMPILRFLSTCNSDCFIACGEDAGKFCFGNAKYHLLPNGINYDLYRMVTEDDVRRVKKELGIEDSSFIIGHVGHFSKQKNHDFIVRLIDEYKYVYPDAKFVLVGDGPLKESIEQAILRNHNSVVFTGVRKDIPVLMKMFDVFILPSLYEGLPVVSIEAQAAGTPCLISDTVDKSLNIGIGLTTFLPINDSYKSWITALETKRNNKYTSVDSNTIYNALFKYGYDIVSSAVKLSEIYDSLIVEKG